MDQLWWEMYNRASGECLTDVKNEGAVIEKFSAQEHDTYTTISVGALLRNLSFTKYISVYLYAI